MPNSLHACSVQILKLERCVGEVKGCKRCCSRVVFCGGEVEICLTHTLQRVSASQVVDSRLLNLRLGIVIMRH